LLSVFSLPRTQDALVAVEFDLDLALDAVVDLGTAVVVGMAVDHDLEIDVVVDLGIVVVLGIAVGVVELQLFVVVELGHHSTYLSQLEEKQPTLQCPVLRTDSGQIFVPLGAGKETGYKHKLVGPQ